MIIGVPKETLPGERRVALIPASVPHLAKVGHEVIVETGAGLAAGYPDDAYKEAGAEIVPDRDTVFARAEVITCVRFAGADPDAYEADLARLKSGQIVFAMMEPLFFADKMPALAEKGVIAFGMELIPRITRAQSMDVLSSMASIAGYKAVLVAADTLPKMFPMMMTAAGTIKAAKVVVIGAGVAGLQAIATAKRLGAVVSAYDVRPAVKEQVESLGGKFIELELETDDAEDAGGYAKEQTEEQIRKQQELMADYIADADAVVTTAAIPGRKSPVIVTTPMVERMRPGSVIVDLASERGGNCELTKHGETIVHNEVTIIGPDNLVSTVAFHASQMYSNNMTTLIKHLTEDGKIQLDLEDEITAGTLVTKGGEVVHERVREQLGLQPLPTPAQDAPEPAASDEGTAD
ncbi:MAG: Re/Si-specific NAD(P)(+) transhydrogenase subunit alpha [Candidatus Dadabacteria bacterium]|nr:MAG: Re/Si-specific NAD(P)(+) transhydrogenase subunit alpha [Candidatus Dadabacteria bacterium]